MRQLEGFLSDGCYKNRHKKPVAKSIFYTSVVSKEISIHKTEKSQTLAFVRTNKYSRF